MAVFVFTDPTVIINGVTLSDHVTKATLNISADDQETTAGGATYRARIGGLKDGSLSLDFNQDFAASSVDATIWSALGTVVTFDVRAGTGARSTTNPSYTGSVLVTEYPPVDANIGDLAKVSVTWPTTGAILRQTA